MKRRRHSSIWNGTTERKYENLLLYYDQFEDDGDFCRDFGKVLRLFCAWCLENCCVNSIYKRMGPMAILCSRDNRMAERGMDVCQKWSFVNL